MKNGVYLVGPVKCSYDEYDSFVVVASSSKNARKLAAAQAKTYGQETCFLEATTKKVGTSNLKEQVMLGSFNAG